MKTPKQWQEDKGEISTKLIRAIQEDAYKQAIEDAIKAIANTGIRMGMFSYLTETIKALKYD